MSIAIHIGLLLCVYVIVVALALGLIFFTYTTAPRWMGREGDALLPFLISNVFIWSLSAAIGGMLIGLFAQWHPNIVAFILGCSLFAVILSMALKRLGKTSLNYDVTVAACASISALGGSLLMQFLHLHIYFNF